MSNDGYALFEQERLVAELRGVVASTKTELCSLAKALESMKAERDAWRETAQQLREEVKQWRQRALEYEHLYVTEHIQHERLKEGMERKDDTNAQSEMS